MRFDHTRRARLRKELRAARLRAKMRQVDVAERLGRPQSYVAKIERGERRIDLVETMNFCDAIGLDVHTLIALIE